MRVDGGKGHFSNAVIVLGRVVHIPGFTVKIKIYFNLSDALFLFSAFPFSRRTAYNCGSGLPEPLSIAWPGTVLHLSKAGSFQRVAVHKSR
jgi:hypothetical protein